MNWKNKVRQFFKDIRDPYILKLLFANLGILALTVMMMVMMVTGVGL